MLPPSTSARDDSACPLSVVVGTTQPWPQARAVLDSVYAQAVAVGAEVILAVRGEEGRPPPSSYAGLKVVSGPGETVFELRMRAIAESSGGVVAVTEDHCEVAPDWCERIIEAHAQFPNADVIGGAVANGACDSSGWAGFLISNGPFLPPLETGERNVVTGHANVSFKRRALWGWGAGGLDDGRYRLQLHQQGGHLMTDGRIAVLHVQAFPPLAMCIYQFHGGRALAGSQRVHLSAAQWCARASKVLLLPLRVAVNTPRIAIRAYLRDSTLSLSMLRCQPWLALLLTFYFSGELVGHFFGPGRSPHHLR